MQQIGNRARSVALGESSLTQRVPQALRQQALFKRTGSSIDLATQQASSRVLEAASRGMQANASALRHVGDRIKASFAQGLAGVALSHVQKPAPPMSPAERKSLAIRHIEQKFGTIKPTFAQVQQTIAQRTSDPATFDKVIEVLKGTKACNVFSFFGALDAFRQAPTLDKALAIVDTYISDPKDDDVGGTAFGGSDAAQEAKPMDVNLYRPTYLSFMAKLDEVKLALAYRKPDADQQLAGLFDKVAQTLQQDLKQVGANMEAAIKNHREGQRQGVSSAGSSASPVWA